jgi:hypothetical protein
MAAERRSEAQARRAAQDEILIEALAAGRSYAEAGRLAGLSGRSVGRRMQAGGEFERQVTQRREETVGRVIGGLSTLAVNALEVIAAHLADPTSPEQMRAATLTLSQLVRFRQVAEFEQRLRDLEARVGLRPAVPSELELEEVSEIRATKPA